MTFLKKILLLDQGPGVMAPVGSALQETGKYVIKEEHDTRHAVNAARWFRPDLILFDGLNSFAADIAPIAQELQSDSSLCGTPVMFVAPNTNDVGGVVSGGFLSGYSFLATPVRIDEVVRYIGDLLSGARA